MSHPIPRLEPQHEPPLAELLHAAQGGDRSAFETIYRHFARVVHGIVVGQCPAAEAEDITQDVFVVIQRKIEQVEDAAALPGWICSVARNTAIDHMRKRKRSPRLVALPELPAREQRDDNALAEVMLSRLQELPEAYRETLALRLIEGMTGEQIAAATGKTHGSVRVNLHKGMQKLRDALRKDGWP